MNKSVKNTALFVLFSAFIFCGSSAHAQKSSQQSDQVAIQLGAIQLGIPNLATASAQDLINALAQGRLALGATESTFAKTVFVEGADTPSPRSPEFRAQLQQAVVAALQNPLGGTSPLKLSGAATLSNGKAITISGTLDPALTTASAILNLALRRIPNLGPDLVIEAIRAAVATPQKFGAPGTGLANANTIAAAAMRMTLRTYAKGTPQWTSISATPPSLPNFSTATVNGVAPSLNGLMDAAAATAANTINALGPTLKNDPDVVAGITSALVRAAAQFQTASQTAVSGSLVRYGGTSGATAMALVAQLAGNAQGDWSNATTGDLLNAIVSGAMSAAKKQVIAVAYGAAAGFAGTYLATGGVAGNFDVNTAAADILASFKATKAAKPSNELNVNAAILAGLNAGLNQANWTDPVNGIAGIGGIKDFTVVNGSGTPFTDTVGL